VHIITYIARNTRCMLPLTQCGLLRSSLTSYAAINLSSMQAVTKKSIWPQHKDDANPSSTQVAGFAFPAVVFHEGSPNTRQKISASSPVFIVTHSYYRLPVIGFIFIREVRSHSSAKHQHPSSTGSTYPGVFAVCILCAGCAG